MYYMIHPNGIRHFCRLGACAGVEENSTRILFITVEPGILLFAIGHIYMAIRADFMEGEGESSSMFSD